MKKAQAIEILNAGDTVRSLDPEDGDITGVVSYVSALYGFALVEWSNGNKTGPTLDQIARVSP